MLALAWVISVIASLVVGYRWRLLGDKITQLLVYRREEAAEDEVVAAPTLIDAEDPVQIVRYEYRERMKKLNPHVYKDPEQP